MIGNQEVEPAEALQGPLDEPPGRRRLGQVGRELAGATGRPGDRPALRLQRGHERPAEPAGGPGHERDPADRTNPCRSVHWMTTPPFGE